MKEIRLTQGKVALVDDADYQRVLSEGRWCAFCQRGRRWAACRHIRGSGHKGKNMLMHRFILRFPDGHIDHIDGNALNNCRSNLRVCGSAQNLWNVGKTIANTSGFKGVRFNRGKWEASIRVHPQRIYLGRFDSAAAAGSAYMQAAERFHKQFARA